MRHQRYQSKKFKQYVVIAFLSISALGWFGMWVYGKYYLTTDDAYVNANVIQIAARISGKVNAIQVVNNDYVNNNQALFIIDPQPYELAVNSARAQLSMNQAQLEKAAITYQRTQLVLKQKFLSPQEGDNVLTHFKVAESNVEYAKAALAQALLNLSYTHITAPSSGWVTNVSLRAGDIVQANQPLFALICDGDFWVDANFKETEIASIKPGQTATLITDMYPNHPYQGVVESISGGTGSAFSLLPPQNATGNWVKITQRIPVRIRILHPDPQFPLRVGSSVAVTIHLRHHLMPVSAST